MPGVIADLQKKIDEVDKRIKEITETPVVSEHAMLRYFERVEGYDLEEIRRKIMPERVEEQVKLIQTGTFPVGVNGSSFRVRAKNRVVLTVLTKDGDKE